MRIEIHERPAVRVAFLRYTGPLGEPLKRFWRTRVAPWLAEQGLLDCPRYGVSLDDPAGPPAGSCTGPSTGHCRYDACVELPPGLGVADATETVLPGGRYAVTRFQGSAADIARAWQEFIAATLGDPARRLDPDRHPFEHYPRGALLDSRSGTFACELCLPLGS